MPKSEDFAETTKQSNVEILRGPAPLTVDDQVIGVCQVVREPVLDYKTKQPTDEKLVYVVAAPGIGRAQKMRHAYAVGALTALGLVPATVTVKKGQREIEVTAESVEFLADGWKVVEDE